MRHWMNSVALAGAVIAMAAIGHAQTPAVSVTGSPPLAPAASVPGGIDMPTYIIGPGDLLGIIFWREKELSGDVQVLPDGRITLPLINELPAAGLTLEELRHRVQEAGRRFVTDPTATIVVRQVNSRKVFITGMVVKPGPYPLYGPMSVLQLIATASGVLEYAKKDEIVIIRSENGKQITFTFNYNDVTKRKNLWQNIELKPGDTVIVP